MNRLALRRWHLLPALLLVLAGPALADGGSGRSQDLARSPADDPLSERAGDIIWSEEDPSLALFLPQEVLSATPLEDLPRGSGEASIRKAMEFPEGHLARRFPGRCFFEGSLGGARRPEAKRTITSWVARQPLSFVATVVDRVPGWSTRLDRPVTLVYARVDDILTNLPGASSEDPRFRRFRELEPVRLGQVVAFFEDEATLDLYGVPTCSRLPEGVLRTSVGEQVLFTGSKHQRHSFLLSRYYIFPVEDGLVLPQPWTGLKSSEPLALTEVKQAVVSGDGR